MPSNTSVSFGVTDSGLRYVSAPAKASQIFTVEEFEEPESRMCGTETA